MATRKKYLYKLNVYIPDELKWPYEPPNWWEVFGVGLDNEDFSWPNYHRHYLSYTSAKRRADMLIKLGAAVEIIRSHPVEWPE